MNLSTPTDAKPTHAKSFHGLTGAAAVLAATLGLSVFGPHRALAAPFTAPGAADLGVTILSPDPHQPLSGVKPVEVSAFYQGSPANQIVAVELFIDGAKAAAKTLDVPETRGVVSFLIDAGQISAGTHQIVIRATAADQEVQSAKSRFTFEGMDPGATRLLAPGTGGGPALPAAPNTSSGLPPTLKLLSPTPDGKVQGVVTLRVQAADPSGKAPYVSLFIDKTFVTLRNYAPYEFEWDTTAAANGYHTIEVYGYNDTAGAVGQTKALRLYVNNPGGQTGIRHDLLDAPKAKAPKPARIFAAPKKPAALPEQYLAPAQIAALRTAPRPRSTEAIVRQMVSGARGLHLGPAGFGRAEFATELSSPFAAPAVVQPAPVRAKSVRAKFVRPKFVRPQAAGPLPASAEIAETPARSLRGGTPQNSTPGRKARLPQMASLRLPGGELASPFAVLPHAGPLAAPAAVKPVVVKPAALRMHMPQIHALHVHLPMSMMSSLLRSAGQRTLLFNSRAVTIDRPLTVQNQVLFGPLRQIFEQGGGTLTWQSVSGTVRAKSATKDILLTLGNTQARVNAKQVTLDGKPYLLMGRTMVPLSFIGLALDADVQFDPATGHLLVTSRK